MKFIHIADTHLGLSQFNKLDPITGMNLREKQIYDNFLLSIQQILSHKPDAIVHAGDLFDQVKPKTKAYKVVLEAMDLIHSDGIPLIIIAGNHSMVKTKYTTSPFEILDHHPCEIKSAYKFKYESVEFGDTIFHLIPNMLKIEDYQKEFQQIGLSKSHHNVLVTHGLASSIKDKRLATVAEHEITDDILSSEFNYIALGHYHGRSQVKNNAWYSGSVEYLTYGEINHLKGGILVDLEKVPQGAFDCNGVGIQSISLPRTEMTDLGVIQCKDVPSKEVISGVVELIESKNLPERSMAQVTLDGISKEHGKLDMKGLSKIRENLLDLKIRTLSGESNGITPCEQDIHAIDYLKEFNTFLNKQQLGMKKEYVSNCGLKVLQSVIHTHREDS